MAGFYGQESDARAAAGRMRHDQGLRSAQVLLLGPHDAAAARFAKQARRWAGGPQSGLGVPWALAGLAGLLALAVAAGNWLVETDMSNGMFWLVLLLAVLSGGLIAGLAAASWPEPPRVRRFENSIQQQLGEGFWALVVHGVPVGRQPAVVALLRGSSLRWCAVALPASRL
jgi:hypothetical protein